jgi:hypothetical protein
MRWAWRLCNAAMPWSAPWDRYPNGPRPAGGCRSAASEHHGRRGSGARASSGLRTRARPRPNGRGAPKPAANFLAP